MGQENSPIGKHCEISRIRNGQNKGYTLTKDLKSYLPLILIKPWVDSLFEVFGFQCDDIFSFLTWHSYITILGWVSLMITVVFALDGLECDRILPCHFWQKPAARTITTGVRHVHLKLDLVINNYSDHFGIGGSFDGFKSSWGLAARGCLWLIL